MPQNLQLEISNQGKLGVSVEVRGETYYDVKAISAGGQTSFDNRDTAWFLRPANHNYDFTVYNQKDHSVLCEGLAQVRNYWDFGPKILACRATTWHGNCSVSQQQHSDGNCQIKISIAE
ncbi:MAG: hypothetical protein K9K66_10120 [Desulfarculaceae bacterium]|nr:hypothetical protein [Desulfarculaceae bacterium]MCF8073763.1 hypothetical protein [Desulfarculaceae bacterium]MCF8102004.1 hypothetical protein [Desulfarculaceae bacterium]MCF8115974.1 hypothetical protein [Desulfarculaceae bacterium]